MLSFCRRAVRHLPRRFRSRDFCALAGLVVCFVLFLSLQHQPVQHARDQLVNEYQRLPMMHELQSDDAESVVVRLSQILERMDGVKLSADARSTDAVDMTKCDGAAVAVRRPAEHADEPFVWQKVSPDSDVFVYSAHIDSRWRPTPIVLVIGLSAEHMVGGGGRRRFCRLWYIGVEQPVVVPTMTRYVPESHGRRYAVSFDVCSMHNASLTPYAVSLINDACDRSTHNLLKVVGPPPASSRHNDTRKVNFTVCVTPFNFNYNNYHQLTEMIEVSRLFGAQHFVFYNYSTGRNVKFYLDAYARRGLVTVVQWPLPVSVEVWPPDSRITPEVHYFGQLAALNDCLYRSLHRSSTFVVYEDLDELLVPRRGATWTDVLTAASSDWTPNGGSFPGAYVVRNTFFRTDWPDDPDVTRAAVDRHVVTLLKTQRESKIFEHNQRSKFVVWTKAAVMVGVHQPLELMFGASTALVDDQTALVHHYRLWIDDPNNPPRIVVDRHMHRFADDILRRVATGHRLVEEQRSSAG